VNQANERNCSAGLLIEGKKDVNEIFWERKKKRLTPENGEKNSRNILLNSCTKKGKDKKERDPGKKQRASEPFSLSAAGSLPLSLYFFWE